MSVSPGSVDNQLPNPQAEVHPHPMSLTDGCPECVRNVETPSSTYRTPDGTLANYVCLDCGTPWTTNWRD